MAGAKLRVKEGPLAGQLLELDHDVVIGRVSADITIDDRELSRRHAVLRPGKRALEIEDLGSLNGTWVNGRRIETTTLAPGDLVTIGESVLQVEDVPADDEQITRVAGQAASIEAGARSAAPPPAHLAAPERSPAIAPGEARVEAPATPFTPPDAERRSRVATRLVAPAVLSFAAIAATAIGLIIYFAQH
jgi:pSer/pThr/pTyr-binding forkhead associated (FHA) protein